MSNTFRNTAILAACLLASACTDDKVADETSVSTPSVAADAAPAPSPAPVAAVLSAWSGSLDGLGETPLCAVDAANGLPAADGAFALQTGQPASFEGWAAMTNLDNPGPVNIILDGEQDFKINGATGVSREDVATAYNSPRLAQAGFKVEIADLAVPPGEYQMVVEHTESGVPVICRPNMRVVAN